MILGARVVRDTTRGAWQAGVRLKNAWGAVDPAKRHLAYRAVLATNLTITLTYRTIPALHESGARQIGEAVGKLVGDVVVGGQSMVGDTLAGAFEGMLRDVPSLARRLLYWAVMLTFVLAFIFVAKKLVFSRAPIKSRRRRAAAS